MCMSSPKMPAPSAPPPAAQDLGQQRAVMADRERKKLAYAKGRGSTMLTDTQSAAAGATTKKTLLGA